jgi:hypothetical protein
VASRDGNARSAPRSIAAAGVTGALIAVIVPPSAASTGASPGAAVVWVVATFTGWDALCGLAWRRLVGVGAAHGEGSFGRPS